MSALDTQVGGSHYREGGIQPIQYIEANSLQFLEASVVKRVTRHNRATGKGRQDIEKAIHELQLLLELRYVEPAPEWPEDEQRIDAIGQNGNGGEHYLTPEEMTKGITDHLRRGDCIHRWTQVIGMKICVKCGACKA
jgi:hypothetical protein